MRTVRVYRMDEYYWMAAHNKREAKKGFIQFLDSVGDETDGQIDPTRVSDEEMKELTYFDDLSDKESSKSRSFEDELKRRLLAGEQAPFLFAFSESAV